MYKSIVYWYCIYTCRFIISYDIIIKDNNSYGFKYIHVSHFTNLGLLLLITNIPTLIVHDVFDCMASMYLMSMLRWRNVVYKDRSWTSEKVHCNNWVGNRLKLVKKKQCRTLILNLQRYCLKDADHVQYQWIEAFIKYIQMPCVNKVC